MFLIDLISQNVRSFTTFSNLLDPLQYETTLIVKNDFILKMTPERGTKHFITSQKRDFLAQHPKKPLNKMTHPDGKK